MRLAFGRSGVRSAPGRLAVRLAAGAGAGALMAAAAFAEQGAAPNFDNGGRFQPYVIDGPSERGPSRPAAAAPAQDRDAEAVPPPIPVAPPATASPPRVAANRGAGGCANPNAIGLSREVEIDATGGPRYGFQQYKTIDFLRDGEIVLTFDDGPAPAYTKPILDALAHHCTKATFFIVGRNALAHPEVVRDEYARGHTIANHTWSHANLGPRRIVPKRTPHAEDGTAGPAGLSLSGQPVVTGSTSTRHGDPFYAPYGGSGLDPSAPPKPTFAPPMAADKAKAEIELGFSATSRSLGVPMAPFFRFPYLGNSTAMQNYLSERNVATFSIDVDSVDYRAKKADDVIHRVLTDLKDQKKGILLFHDIQPATAHAMPALLDLLHERGYKVVHLKPKAGLQTIASYDARVGKDGVKQDAIAEKKPLVKRTVTWGMAPAEGAGSAVAARANDAYRPPSQPAARRPAQREDNPSYIPPSNGQQEVLPWLTPSRRNSGW